jgi:hypothetical protein
MQWATVERNRVLAMSENFVKPSLLRRYCNEQANGSAQWTVGDRIRLKVNLQLCLYPSNDLARRF